MMGSRVSKIIIYQLSRGGEIITTFSCLLSLFLIRSDKFGALIKKKQRLILFTFVVRKLN